MYSVLFQRKVAAWLFACAAPIALPLTHGTSAAELRFDPVTAKAPPRVAQASIELLAKPLASGNTVLRVQFADRRSDAPVVIQGGLGLTALRDDGVAPDEKAGDGHYAAFVNVNVDQLAKERERRLGLARRVKDAPVFFMRELHGFEPFQPNRSMKLEPGVASILDKFHGIPLTVDPARELVITDTLVVEDPARTYDACTGVGTQLGPWTFGKLMTEIANEPVTGINPADLVEHWINQWKSDLPINGFTVQNRAVGAQRVLDAWPRMLDGRLDLAQAPFRLLAIVNRLDLRGATLYGSSDAGEGRLVFGALNCLQPQPGQPILPQAMPFTVIFEYGVVKTGCFQVREWAQQWHALGSLVIGSATYNAALQAITDQFTLRDANPARLPNRSAINQVRTNEFALATTPADTFWELRESKLRTSGAASGLLEHDTVAQTPDKSKQFTSVLRNFVNMNEADVLNGTHEVLLEFPAAGSPFRGGHIEPGAGFAWDASGILNLEARHRFSLATCNGCHTAETKTAFLHIHPRNAGSAAELSDFLTGLNMPKTDPVNGASRTFHELLDRQQKLDLTANMSCIKPIDFPLEEIFFDPVPPVFAH